MRKVRLLQVGLGFWGRDWAAEILPGAADLVEVVGRVDPDPGAAARLEAALPFPPGPCFPSLREALAAVDCEAVLLTLRTAAHHLAAAEALRAGKHVIVEKPFAATLGEAADLVRLARARGLLLMVSQNYRFYPAPIAAADLVASGTLGALQSVALDFRRNAPAEGYRYYEIPEPLLGDMSIHHFDLMRMVLGAEPVDVSCRTWNPPGSPFAHDPCAAATIRFANDAVVSYRGSWLSRGPATAWAGEWAMDLAGGSIAWTARGSKGMRLLSERIASGRGDEPAEPRVLEMFEEHDRAGTIAAFARALLSGATPPRFSSGRDNMGSLALVVASTLSASRGGAPVALDEVLPADFALGGPA